MSTLLILNAKIVNENSIVESDIYIRNGRIEKIGKDLSSMKVLHVLDVRGKYIMPGMIDDNVHFRTPDIQGKSNLYCESQAAVAGGITTFFDMPDSLPRTMDINVLEEKMKLASKKSIANYSFYLGASSDNLEVIKSLGRNQNCGIKVCLGDASGRVLLDKPETLATVFEHAPGLVAAHCEYMPIIVENEESYRQIYGDDIPFQLHPKLRSEEACYTSSSFAIELAQTYDTRLHVLQVSTAKEVELFSDVSIHEKRITAEVSYPFLEFTDDDYANDDDHSHSDGSGNKISKGALIKTNPSIKTEIDRAALFQGLMDNHLDNIGTAHTPYFLDLKKGSYFEVATGMPLVQDAMPSLLEHYHDGIFSLEFLANKTSHAVADIYNIKDRGYIREGYWADIIVIDVETPKVVTNEAVISKCGWSPFSGDELRSQVYATIVNGNLVYINDTVRTGKMGLRVEFDRND